MEKPDIKNEKYRDEKGNFNSGLWNNDKTLYIYDLEKRLKASEQEHQEALKALADIIKKVFEINEKFK